MNKKNFQIKICGITRHCDAIRAAELGAIAVGFVAYKKSPRYISPEDVLSISTELKEDFPSIRLVGVFVNEKINTIKLYVKSGIDVIQLHGDEKAEAAINILNRAKVEFWSNKKLEIWKAIRARSTVEITNNSKYPADKFLIDAFSHLGKGGTGELADWSLAKFAIKTLPRPVILAGGLNYTNIEKALKDVQPYGIDLSSGVEQSPGIKDHVLLEKLFDQIKYLDKT